MDRRCYSSEPINGDRVTLAGGEAHHLLHVLRAAPGMQFVLFDGSGCEFDAEVTACGRSTIELAVRARSVVDRELPFSFTLGVPLPKGERQRWIVEKAVELGVSRLVPLRTSRSVATGDKPGEKLDRYVIEASKQCGRNRLMEIAEPQTWSDWLAAPSATRRLVADPNGRVLVKEDETQFAPVYAAVGPEGGFTDDELAAACAASWEIVSLGPRMLRIETAAIVLAALVTKCAPVAPPPQP